jgi:2-Cys peroxiredoxin 5
VTDYQIREWTVVVGSQANPNYAGVEQVKKGDTFPKGQVLYENTPAGAVDLDAFFKQHKKVVIFGVPGAFTPGCSKTHLPGYIADAEKLQSKGVDALLCVSTDNAFVMAAWGVDQKADGKVRMMSDTTGEMTKRLGLAIDLTAKLGSVRSKRYSLVVEDGVVTQANVEPADAPTGLTCSLASAVKL